MEVTLEQHVGTGLGSGMKKDIPQKRIRVDGFTVGYIGDAAGSVIQLTRRFAPEDKAEIEKQVTALLDRGDLKAKQPPEVPAGLLQAIEDETNDLED